MPQNVASDLGLLCLLRLASLSTRGKYDVSFFHRDAQVAVKQLLELPSDPVDGDQEPVEFSTRLMYKCPVCMRKFRGSNYLKLHMRNHTGTIGRGLGPGSIAQWVIDSRSEGHELEPHLCHITFVEIVCKKKFYGHSPTFTNSRMTVTDESV